MAPTALFACFLGVRLASQGPMLQRFKDLKNTGTQVLHNLRDLPMVIPASTAACASGARLSLTDIRILITLMKRHSGFPVLAQRSRDPVTASCSCCRHILYAAILIVFAECSTSLPSCVQQCNRSWSKLAFDRHSYSEIDYYQPMHR